MIVSIKYRAWFSFMRKKIKDHFIPHAGNDYTPHMLQKTAMLGMLGLILLSFLVANFQALLWQGSSWLVGTVLPSIVTDLTNHERNNLSLTSLRRSAVLDKAAQLKADDMAAGSYFSHTSPAGVTPWYWFEQAGYLFTYAGENLAVHFSDSDEVVEAWMKSPTHRANIVNDNYTEIGIGTARGVYEGYETVFVVQLFGTPAMKSLLPLVAKQEPVVEPFPIIKETISTTSLFQINDDLPIAILGAEITTSSSSPTVPVVENIESDTPNHSDPVISDVNVEFTPINNPTTTDPVVVVNDTHVLMYLDTVSTSTDLIPLPVSTSLSYMSSTSMAIPITARLATQPNNILQVLYIIIGLLTIISLLASVLIEWRKQQLLQVSYGVLLLLLMSGLFYMHVVITAGALVV